MPNRHTFLGWAYVASWRRPESCFGADRRALLDQLFGALDERPREAELLCRWALAMARGIDRYHGLRERLLEREVREIIESESLASGRPLGAGETHDMRAEGPLLDRCR